MQERIFIIGFDIDTLEWLVIDGKDSIVCENSINSANFRYLLGERFGDGNLAYTVLYPLDSNGQITVIAHGGQWTMLGKASLPMEKWGNWAQNLIYEDVMRCLKDQEYRMTRVLPDENESDYDNVIPDDEREDLEIKSDWKPTSVAMIGFKNKESMQKFVDSVDIDKVEGSDGGRVYDDARILLKLIEADRIYN